MSRILFACTLRAGGEAVKAVSDHAKKGHTIRTLIPKSAYGACGKLGLGSLVMPTEEPSLAHCRNQIADFNPDVIVTDTDIQRATEGAPLQKVLGLRPASNMTFQQMLWLAARHERIPSAAIHTGRGHHLERFSDLDFSADPALPHPDRLCLHVPDAVFVMDESIRQAMLKLAIPDHLIKVTGQPHMDEVLREVEDIRSNGPALLKRPAFASLNRDAPTIVFFSDTAPPGVGYSEKSVLESFFRVLNSVAGDAEINVIVRPHPNPDRCKGAHEAFAACDSVPGVRKVLHNPAGDKYPDNQYSMAELLSVAAFAVGTIGNPLFDTSGCGITTVSYQPGMQGESLIDFTGWAEMVTEEADLASVLSNVLKGNALHQPLEIVRGAIDRVMDAISELCHSK